MDPAALGRAFMALLSQDGMNDAAPSGGSGAPPGADSHGETLVAAPARERRFRSASDGPASLSHVQPSSPFDVLCGTAFLHSDTEHVERHCKTGGVNDGSGRRRKKKKRRGNGRSGPTRSTIPPSSKIRPMLSIIAEEELSSPPCSPSGEEAHDLDDDRPRRSVDAPDGGSGGTGVSSAISNFVSGFFDVDKIETLSGSSHAIPDVGAYDDPHEGEGDRGTFALRDFPRTDGTPCLIYDDSRPPFDVQDYKLNPRIRRST